MAEPSTLRMRTRASVKRPRSPAISQVAKGAADHLLVDARRGAAVGKGKTKSKGQGKGARTGRDKRRRATSSGSGSAGAAGSARAGSQLLLDKGKGALRSKRRLSAAAVSQAAAASLALPRPAAAASTALAATFGANAAVPGAHPVVPLDLASRSSGGGEDTHKRKRRRQDETRKEYKARLFQAFDTSDGHLKFSVGDRLRTRTRDYEITGILGEGTFGRVVECLDRKENDLVAIKIIKSIQKYRDAAKAEVKILAALEDWDPLQLCNCVNLEDWFDYCNHICLVFPRLGPSLYDLMKRNAFRPFDIDEVRIFATQLLESLEYLRELHLTHTDIKPENILLVDTDVIEPTRDLSGALRLKNYDIMLIDFGSSTFAWQHHTRVVSTRHYRAPEVVLELGWGQECDMWSLGCVLMELYLGRVLFQTHDNLEHLTMMEAVLGPIPGDVAAASPRTDLFDHANQLAWPPRDQLQTVLQCKPLRDLAFSTHPDHEAFIHFIGELLRFDVTERMAPAVALEHEFFFPDSRSITGTSADTSADATPYSSEGTIDSD